MKNKFVFIVGPQRTGTTYLLLLLLEHKLVTNPFGNPYETDRLNVVYPRQGGTVKKAITYDTEHLMFLDDELDSLDESYIACKNPNWCTNKVEYLLNNFKNCSVIFMVRNPLEVATSYLNAPWAKNLHFIIKTYEDFGKNALKLCDDRRVLFVNSEKLFSEPKNTFKKLLNRLEISFDDNFVDKAVGKHKHGKHIIPAKQKIVYRVGEYSVDNTISKDDQKNIKNTCWNYYKKLLKHCI